MLFTQPGKVVEGGVNTAVMVETVALQRILLLQFIPVHLPVSEVDRNRRDHIAGIQLPGIGDIVKTFGIDFNLAGRSLKRVLNRVGSEFGKRNRILSPAVDLSRTAFPERIPIRQLRNFLACFVVAPFEPLQLSSSFREFLFLAEFLGNQAADFVRSLDPTEVRQPCASAAWKSYRR